MPGEVILIVDDNPVNLKLLKITLTVAGYQVHTAVDAEQALALLASLRPRLILMDIQLPGMDGLALTRRLKADPATRDAVIIAVTAYAMKGDDERALAAGCDGYVTKPIDTRTIADTVAGYLAGSPPQGPP
jgi:CheY-like chemotaxis protein